MLWLPHAAAAGRLQSCGEYEAHVCNGHHKSRRQVVSRSFASAAGPQLHNRTIWPPGSTVTSMGGSCRYWFLMFLHRA